MNCIEFRRLLLTEPLNRQAEFEEHRRGCAACAGAAAQSARLERLIEAGIRVPVPEDLSAKILLRHAFRRPEPSRWPFRLALAASLLLGVLLNAGIRWEDARLESVEREVATMVNMATYAMAANRPIDDHQLDQALQVVGARAEGTVGAATFASQCVVRGKLAGHLVVREDGFSPVTIFVIPDRVVTDRETFREAGWSGVLVPVGKGTIAVLGAGEDVVNRVERRVKNAIRWQVG